MRQTNTFTSPALHLTPCSSRSLGDGVSYPQRLVDEDMDGLLAGSNSSAGNDWDGIAQRYSQMGKDIALNLIGAPLIKGEPELTDPLNLLINVKLRML